MRVPFDNLCVACAVFELERLVGAKLQKVVQVSPSTLAIELYLGKAHWLWVSWDQEFARIHLGSEPQASIELQPFGRELRTRLRGARLHRVEQIAFDRLVELEFTVPESAMTLVVELMGKHANMMLMDDEHRWIAAAKWLGATRSSRPVLPGQIATRPPGVGEAVNGGLPRISPFLEDRIADGEVQESQVLGAFRDRIFAPCRIAGGVYPIPVSLDSTPVSQFGQAVHDWLSAREEQRQLARMRQSLETPLRRLLVAKERALVSLQEAADAARQARQWQMTGELILAFGFAPRDDAKFVEAMDYDGNAIRIPFQADLSVQENADKWFRKAKRAKSGSQEVQDQIKRVDEELEDLRRELGNIEFYVSAEEFERARAYAQHRRWLHAPSQPKAREERPFDGHKIRELLGPNGFVVFYGENAEANDYLTLKLGKPNDIWLHVRGNVSTHVLIQTHNQPERVPHEVLRFAAEIAVRHSPLKHSAMVPVDYTLKKYVRRSRGAAKGMVTYSHEKTLHVDTRP